MNGSSTVTCSNTSLDCGPYGVYGTLGTPAAENTPGGRQSGSTWIDREGKLWLFGGEGIDANGNSGYLNDLWKYDPTINQWEWIGGSSTLRNGCCNQPGVYGTMGDPTPGNIPGSRFSASNWIDPSGHFWLFGGVGGDETGGTGILKDLWEFYPTTNEWAWMGGNQIIGSYWDQSGWYGTLGTATVGDIPGARQLSSSWTDSSGNLWLLGGSGYAVATATRASLGDLNDLWEFNPSTSEWAWMNGSDQANETGVYGQLGIPAVGNTPDPRDSATSWTDGSGNFWIFGGGWGSVSNDLWNFNPSMNEWAWIGGSSTVYTPAKYGVLGIPSTVNLPGDRRGANGWTDRNGNLWLFGGWGMDTNGNWGSLNDFWKYQPYANAATPTFGVATGTYTTTQSVTISDATAGAIIYYTTNGTAPTTSSIRYTDAITISSTETLTAIAVATNYTASAVATATYTIPPDFSVASSPASLTVTSGQSGTATVSVTPLYGFNSAVSFTCSGLPAGASCSFAPQTVTPSGGVASTTLTVKTATTTAALPRNSNPMLPGSALALALCCFGWRKRRRLQIFLLLAVSVAGASIFTGCNAASSSTTQPVTSTITVTATAGSVQHSSTISLTVN
jgi:N-acetylneuraminic acid mutarotase